MAGLDSRPQSAAEERRRSVASSLIRFVSRRPVPRVQRATPCAPRPPGPAPTSALGATDALHEPGERGDARFFKPGGHGRLESVPDGVIRARIPDHEILQPAQGLQLPLDETGPPGA
jgi:hypothetical protein